MKNLINSLLRLSLVALLSMAISTTGMCQTGTSSSDKVETQKLQKKVKDVEERVQDVVKDVEQDHARDRSKEKRDQSDKAPGSKRDKEIKEAVHGEDATTVKSVDVPDYNSDEEKIIRKDRSDRRDARLLSVSDRSGNVDKDYKDAVQGEGKSRGASALSAHEQRAIGSRASAQEAISDGEATLNQVRAWLEGQKAMLDEALSSGVMTKEQHGQQMSKLRVLREKMQDLETQISNGKNVDKEVDSSGLLPGMVY